MWQFLKGFLSILSVIILSTLLSFFIVSFSFAQSTKPDTLKPLFKGLFESAMLDKTDLNESYSNFLMACYNREYLEIHLDKENKTPLSIPCKEISEGNSGKLSEILADSLFNKIYYSDYDCISIDCIKKIDSPMFLFSKVGNTLLSKSSYIILIVFFILLAAFSFIIKLKGIASVFILNGISSFIFFLKDRISSQILNNRMLRYFEPFVSSFIYYISIISVVCLGIGIILLLAHRILAAKGKKPKKKKK